MTSRRFTRTGGDYIPGIERKPMDPTLRLHTHGPVEPMVERPVFRMREFVAGVGILLAFCGGLWFLAAVS